MADDSLDNLVTPKLLLSSQYDYLQGFQESRTKAMRETYPKESFAAVAAVLWGYQDLEATKIYWNLEAVSFPENCEEMLAVLEYTLHNPPEDFVALLETFANIRFIRKEQPGFSEGEFTFDNYRAWLRDQIIDLRTILHMKYPAKYYQSK